MRAVNTKQTAALNFERLRVRFGDGEKAAALHALAFAYYLKVPPPDWAIAHVLQGYQRWGYAEVRTLDEALEIERPKGFRLDAASRAIQHGGSILMEVNKRLETEPYDDQIFEDAGQRWGIGKTVAKEIYYAAMKNLKDNHPGTYQAILSSRESAKKPAVSRRKK